MLGGKSIFSLFEQILSLFSLPKIYQAEFVSETNCEMSVLRSLAFGWVAKRVLKFAYKRSEAFLCFYQLHILSSSLNRTKLYRIFISTWCDVKQSLLLRFKSFWSFGNQSFLWNVNFSQNKVKVIIPFFGAQLLTWTFTPRLEEEGMEIFIGENSFSAHENSRRSLRFLSQKTFCFDGKNVDLDFRQWKLIASSLSIVKL